jgi:hypothetical protein
MGTDTAPFADFVTMARARRLVMAAVRSEWVGRWSDTGPSGGFALADRWKPSFKPSPWFEKLPRELYGRVTQCWTGHAHIGDYYRRFNLPEETLCRTGGVLQTREHVLVEHEDYRHIITDALGNDWRMTDLLGTGDSIKILAELLQSSKHTTRHQLYAPYVPLFIHRYHAHMPQVFGPTSHLQQQYLISPSRYPTY